MNLIGDLERLFATSLYPNRVPIAVAAAVLAVLLLVTARRRGWFAAARRHPRRTGLVVVIALAVGLPSAWYLGSPLFIRTALDEPQPSAAPASPSAPAATPDGLADPRTGTFVGADEFHFGSGTATLIETAAGAWTVRFENFSVRNGPDLYVYVSPDPAGYTGAAIEVGQLRATDGNFNMDLPAGALGTGAASVVIWCKQFAVQFAVAAFPA